MLVCEYALIVHRCLKIEGAVHPLVRIHRHGVVALVHLREDELFRVRVISEGIAVGIRCQHRVEMLVEEPHPGGRVHGACRTPR